MKVLLRKNVSKLGQIGDVVEVRAGYARNYLIPQGIAAQPTETNLKVIEAEKQKYLEELAGQKAEVQARAAAVDGKEVTIHARATDEGQLYGSVGPAQVCAALVAEGVFVEPENIVLDSLIRRLDKYEVAVRFGEDVAATVHVWVLPLRDTEDEEAPAEGEEPAGGSEPEQAAGAGEPGEEKS